MNFWTSLISPWHSSGPPSAVYNVSPPLLMLLNHRYRGEIPKLAAIFSQHGEQFGGIRFYSESACVNCIFLRYERVFNRGRKAATSATHIKVIGRVICIAHSPHLFSAKSRIPPNCSPCREKNLRGRYWNFGISVSISVFWMCKPTFNPSSETYSCVLTVLLAVVNSDYTVTV